MEALAGRDRRSQTAPQMLTAAGERRLVGGGEVEAHHPEQGVQEPFGLAQREMVDEPQGQSGLDGEIRVAPLPTPPAAPAGRPGSDRFRGHPHRHIAAANEGPVVGGQFATRYFVLYVGWTFDFIPVVWLLRRVTRSTGQTASPPQGLHATTPVLAPFAVDQAADLCSCGHENDDSAAGLVCMSWTATGTRTTATWNA